MACHVYFLHKRSFAMRLVLRPTDSLSLSLAYRGAADDDDACAPGSPRPPSPAATFAGAFWLNSSARTYATIAHRSSTGICAEYAGMLRMPFVIVLKI